MGAIPVSIAAPLLIRLAHPLVFVAVRLLTLVVSVACRPKVSSDWTLHDAQDLALHDAIEVSVVACNITTRQAFAAAKRQQIPTCSTASRNVKTLKRAHLSSSYLQYGLL